MSQYQLTTEQEAIFDKVNEAIAANNLDEATRLTKLIPMVPEIAKAAKEALGAEYLRQSGFNLSAAEAAYGKDWLLR
jgi:hypothetical protein